MSDRPGPKIWGRLVRGPDMLVAEPVAPGVTRLSEAILTPPERSYFYLVEGRDRDCLIDGGWGFSRSLGKLRPHSGKPLVAIATHSHFDHIGMLHLAPERLGHRAEASVFADPDPLGTQALPFLADRPVLVGHACLRADSIEQRPCPLTGLVDDGAAVDLGGGVVLRVMHTPGHSPGSLSILCERRGLLFCADTLHDGYIYDAIPGADRRALLRSHERLREAGFAIACPGHGAALDRVEAVEVMDGYRSGNRIV
jgi:glyoxylase-like metal-dependent hydrolase (beta-lactamase superfamily II)